MIQKITSRWQHQDKVKVEWNLGKRCNYDCSYCPSEIHDNTSRHTDINILRSAVNELVKTPNIRISFTGGEPCVHPEFEELVSYCKSMGVSWINVTTNGTRKADYYIALPCDHYVFSLHFEYDWEKVLETIIEVHRFSKRPCMVNVMAHQDKMTECRIAVDKLKEFNIPLVVRRIRWTAGDHDVFDDGKYTQDDLRYILDNTSTVEPNCIVDDTELYHANDIIKLHLNQYKGWQCNAGIESLMINQDGEVYRATCRVGNSIGNIYKGSFFQPTNGIICTREFCTCAADIPLTKKNNG